MSPTLAGGFFTTEPPGKLPPTIHFFDIAGGSLNSASVICPELTWEAVNYRREGLQKQGKIDFNQEQP